MLSRVESTMVNWNSALLHSPKNPRLLWDFTFYCYYNASSFEFLFFFFFFIYALPKNESFANKAFLSLYLFFSLNYSRICRYMHCTQKGDKIAIKNISSSVDVVAEVDLLAFEWFIERFLQHSSRWQILHEKLFWMSLHPHIKSKVIETSSEKTFFLLFSVHKNLDSFCVWRVSGDVAGKQ